MRGCTRLAAAVGFVIALACTLTAAAAEMDLALSRLKIPPGQSGCPQNGPVCANDEAFERLVSDLAVGLAPPVLGGAASLGPRGFGLSLSASVTPIDADYWGFGTRGPNAIGENQNPAADGVLLWNRVEARKGLPFGFEVAGALGHGLNTSLWVLSGELRAVLFEGYRSGLGALPDVALRGVVQTLVGSPQLSLRTLALDVTLSKPYVIASRHRVTPLVALQALFVDARSKPVDLTPETSDWDVCGSAPPGGKLEPACANPSRESTTLDVTRFDSFDQTRIRLFVGVEEHYAWLRCALTVGFDLSVPELHAEDIADQTQGGLAHAVTVNLSAGLRY